MNLPPEVPSRPPRPRSPAPHIEPVPMWPTPNEEDVVFYVERNGDLPQNKKWSYGDAYIDPIKYPNHKLVYVAPQTEDNWSRWYYASKRVLEDEYNWEFTDADIGGTRFEAVTRTYLRLRAEFDPLAPAMGENMPNLPEDKFTQGPYVLAERKQLQAPEEFKSLFVAEVRTYVIKTTISGVLVDEFSNKSHAVAVDLYYRGEIVGATALTVEALFAAPTDSFWNAFATTAGGTTTYYRREGRQLTTNWYSIETVPIVSGALEDGALTVHDYFTSADYTWPAVLADVAVVVWPKRAGGQDDFWVPIYSRYRYSGPCKARIVMAWKPIEFSGVAPDVPMLPEPIAIATPYFSVSVPATLHEESLLTFTNGTTDPVYKLGVLNVTIPATNYADWPASIVAADTQKPYKGGFLRETVTIFKPDTLP